MMMISIIILCALIIKDQIICRLPSIIIAQCPQQVMISYQYSLHSNCICVGVQFGFVIQVHPESCHHVPETGSR